MPGESRDHGVMFRDDCLFQIRVGDEMNPVFVTATDREAVLQLRTGGRDQYSGMSLDEFRAAIGHDVDDLLQEMASYAAANGVENEYMPWGSLEQTNALRWVCRGVAIELAVYRAQVDRLRSRKYPEEWYAIQRVRCGRDAFSQMSVRDLLDHLDERGPIYQGTAAGLWDDCNCQYARSLILTDARLAAILRWACRGMMVSDAVAKIWMATARMDG
jgi:hypothetical protein